MSPVILYGFAYNAIMGTIGCVLTNSWALGGECTSDGVG